MNMPWFSSTSSSADLNVPADFSRLFFFLEVRAFFHPSEHVHLHHSASNVIEAKGKIIPQLQWFAL